LGFFVGDAFDVDDRERRMKGVVKRAMSIVFVLGFTSPVSFDAAFSSPPTLDLAPCGLFGVPTTCDGDDGADAFADSAFADAELASVSPPLSTDACNSLARVVTTCPELRSPVNTYRAASVALRGVAVVVLSTYARIAETTRPLATFSTSSNPNAAANCMRSRISPLLSVPCVRHSFGRASSSVDRFERVECDRIESKSNQPPPRECTN
jgi:hypothetical protein